jgi:archaeosortase B (VPXXXP-CTERM-specific)
VLERLFQPIRDRLGEPTVALGGFLARLLLYLWLATLLIRRLEALYLQTIQESTAGAVGKLIAAFSERATQHADVVTYDGFSVRIVSECFGLLEMAIFSAAVLAFATTWRKRAIGIAVGVPTIYAFNLARIVMLLWVGRHANTYFEFIHVYFWQATLILVITSLWLVWIHLVVGDETGPVVRA